MRFGLRLDFVAILSLLLAAKELGGSLSVFSQGTGQGAVFTLELPANGVRAKKG